VTKKTIHSQPTPKSERDARVTVNTDWQHTEEMSPAFTRLMTILLRERIENGERTGAEPTGPDYPML